jgi:hypothetical protein
MTEYYQKTSREEKERTKTCQGAEMKRGMVQTEKDSSFPRVKNVMQKCNGHLKNRAYSKSAVASENYGAPKCWQGQKSSIAQGNNLKIDC